jgi:hypothetical protein
VAKPIGELHDAERDHAAGFPDRAIELRVSVLHVEYRCAHFRVSKAGQLEPTVKKRLVLSCQTVSSPMSHSASTAPCMIASNHITAKI